MNIITISRQYGSGGRELGKHIAQVLGYDYYDKEILSTIASNTGMDENYVERTLEQDRWLNVPLTFHQSVSSISLDSTHTDLLLERKRVIEEIAATGKNCVIVGRNADILLRKHYPFNIFVCADIDTKMNRCKERSPKEECLTEKDLERKIHKIDKSRAQTRALITDIAWGDSSAYHLTVNTSQWNLEELAPAVVEFAKRWFDTIHR